MNEFLKLRAEYLFCYFASSNVAVRGLKLMSLLRHAEYSFSHCQFFHSFQRFVPIKGDHCSRNLCSDNPSIQEFLFSGLVICTSLKRKLDELKTYVKWNEPIYQMI
jgi:hypothetical protein